ncbi:MAG: NADH-quinone oxidoreductase subunit M [Verrucomicrobiae bacterium]|nr:NADH-quinone oxidoreductase subunit M [Verrucomicrobiae bacterium]
MNLSFMIWLPIGAAMVLFALPWTGWRMPRQLALLVMMTQLVFSICILAGAPAYGLAMGMEQHVAWCPGLGISYHLGVDRLSAILLVLTSLVGLAAVSVSAVKENARYFYGMGLLMAGGMSGAFMSLDLFFMYVFHELALIPTFILIAIWGAERRRAAAMKITLYLGLASLVLLLGFLGLHGAGGGQGTFDLIELRQRLGGGEGLSVQTQTVLFGILLLGFGGLVAVVPFHTWAPAGYGEAPPMAAMLHSGVIKKFGLYGLFRVAIPLLPDGFQQWREILVILAGMNLVYAGYVAMQQKDLRYMLAYASVSHMGYALLALAAGGAIATQGFILFLFAHGVGAALGFGVAGFLRQRTGTAVMGDLGGFARQLPAASTLLTIAALAGFGLPGFAGFPAELMIFIGGFEFSRVVTVLAVWTTVISAVYYLRAVRQIAFGPLPGKWNALTDLSLEPKMALVLLVAALLLAGICPHLLLGDLGGSVSIQMAAR